ncbi:phosphate/phosphite/phosphonate ABC transporter substrate-binding protein [Salipaludibacillus sp. CUR1]|uniref:phosphate/phosphite/phosphonate ABC transporter substrate-binding protein n=1 Tax=Salipaludibacillus sp. CUR1 TaxID=2820003 RepID=UPI001E436BCE|nr:phosphate/phosphite/phosphonate ABC transporter substrate-binding protein [Salipaludibacillus sp. CUR1]MCE7794092.1 phosphate/phosphite/phosphonate ABC transporter substrate-binding protein [Salipaludibacillus sp. CUR1]
MTKWIFSLMTALTLVVVTACGENNADNSAEEAAAGASANENSSEASNKDNGEAGDREDWPDTFIFGLLPTEDQAELAKRFDPMVEYLEEYLEMDVEIYNATNYTALIEAMANGHLHASTFGPFSYLVANQRANGEAFAIPVNDEGGTLDDIFYYAQMITLEEHGIDSLEDIEGNSLAYADPASTSGHLFPKAMLINEIGLTLDNVDEFPSDVVFSGSHEASLYSVLNGDVKTAGVCSTCIERVFDRVEDHENFDQLKVFHESEPIPGGPYVIQGDLPDSFKETVTQAFLEMDQDEKGAEFLEVNGYLGGYFEIDHDTYNVVQETADALGMSPEELLE